MERLCALKQEGMLTEEEFIWAKAQLMAGKGPADDDRLDSPSGEAPLPSVASAAGTSRSLLYSSNRVAPSTAPDDGEADESGSRRQLPDAANVGGDHGANVDPDGGQQEPSSPPPCPGFLKRHLAIVPPIETLGLFLKEQMPVFRKHWVESKRHDGRSLREDMIMLFESQLTTAALLFSAFTGLMFGAVTEENWDAFHADDWPTHIGFWLITVGTFSCINSMFYLMFSFVAIMIILPVSDQNIYFLLKLPSTQRTMTQVNVQLIITFFSGIAFIALMLIDRSRNSIFMISLILTIIFIISQIIAFTFSHTLNLSMLGGFCESSSPPCLISLPPPVLSCAARPSP
jgi:hypothetical protein